MRRTPTPQLRLARLAAHITSWQYGGGAAGQALYEFGQKEWCAAVVAHAVRLLRSVPEVQQIRAWGFSEEYCQCPDRLAQHFDDKRSVYWLMVRDGEISGGTSVRDAGWHQCLKMPGFHVTAEWGLIAHASGMIYGSEGMPQRAKDTTRLEKDLYAAHRPQSKAFLKHKATKPAGPDTSDPAGMRRAFPPAIGKALSGRPAGLEGLHNAGALLMKPSPEVASLPMTAIGIPDHRKMNAAERMRLYEVLQRPHRETTRRRGRGK